MNNQILPVERPGIYYGWWLVLISFFIASYVAGAVFFSLTAFIEPIVAEFSWSYTQVSLVSTIRGLEIGIFSLFIGFFVDRFGAKKLLIFGLITTGIGILLFSQTQSLAWFFFSFVVLSFGAGGCTSVVLTTIMAKWFNKNMGKALGIMVCGFGSGGLLVPGIVWLIERFQWRTTLIMLAAGLYLTALPLAFLIRDEPKPGDYVPEGELPDEDEFEDGDQPNGENKERDNFNKAIKSTTFWLFNFAEAARMIMLASVMMYIMPYLTSVGYSRTTAGFLAAATPVMSIIGRFSFGWLGDSLNKRTVLIFSHSFMGLGVLSLSFIHNHWMIVPYLIFFPIGYGGSMPLRGLVIKHYFGTASIGRLLGISMGVAAIGGMIGPILAGWAFDTYQTYRIIWLTYIGLSVISVLVISRLQK
ncbi:MAG: MFS transporter [bacterium]|nr:MFS transporter [bacterium]